MITVINPANHEKVRTIQSDNSTTVRDKFQKAREAQPSWNSTPYATRYHCIQKFSELLREEIPALARDLSLEVGKPIAQSRNELNGLLTRIDFFLSQSEKCLLPISVFEDPSQKLQELITQEPLGVIANISAWNYPYFVGSNVFIPALLTGNAVLYKPSEYALLTGQHIERLLHQAGIPRDIFQTIVGAGEVGMDLLSQDIDGIFFTGSYETGRRINELVASRLIKVQLELGGKDPSYVCNDVNVKTTAEALADGAFYNNGQSCCSVERIYVHEKVYDEFNQHFLATVRGFKIGDPLDDKTYLGPLTRPQQLEYLEAQVADAINKGAKLLYGGKRIKSIGNYFEPTVLTQVNHSMAVMREESFGPIIGIQKVSSDEEAIQWMNDTDYGLTAGVYTPDENRAKQVLSAVNAGSVYWNICDRVSPRLPWSGRKHSGIGCTLSKYGIETFLRPKAWHLKRM